MPEVLIDGRRYVPELQQPAGVDWTLAEAIRMARGNLSLDKLAAMTGISKTYLWELESGKATEPSFRVVCRIALATHTPIEAFAACRMPITPIPTENI
jgi:transcriptional regulator with XRE-family HTH domain